MDAHSEDRQSQRKAAGEQYEYEVGFCTKSDQHSPQDIIMNTSSQEVPA